MCAQKIGLVFDVFGQGAFLPGTPKPPDPGIGINQTAPCLNWEQHYQARYVATNDVHYINASDYRLQDILLRFKPVRFSATQTGCG